VAGGVLVVHACLCRIVRQVVLSGLELSLFVRQWFVVLCRRLLVRTGGARLVVHFLS